MSALPWSLGPSPSQPHVRRTRSHIAENVSPSEKEVEAEFLRLSLGFKCDLFTLEKRVRLEERSRDLAEGNLRKEIASSLKLLDSLASLSDDNQVQEIAKKLQKSLELLNQHATRIASKAEMLGAIHQESRVSKAVEVMIQHVENLKRTYAREHAELEELKEVLLQNRRSFSSVGDRDEAAIKKLSGSLKGQLNETDGGQRNDKFSRRPSWALLGAKQGEKPPLLQRYVSYSSWTESEEDQAEAENSSFDLPPPDQGSKTQKLSEKESSPSKWRLLSLCTRAFSWTSHARTSFCQASKALYVSVVAVVLLAVLLAFLLGLQKLLLLELAMLGPRYNSCCGLILVSITKDHHLCDSLVALKTVSLHPYLWNQLTAGSGKGRTVTLFICSMIQDPLVLENAAQNETEFFLVLQNSAK
ncbi:Lymphoid-restricted membrane protein [Varanus komodoensis]|nr:Lymphoid-restricted membrane protein [Varanus komodoensis]